MIFLTIIIHVTIAMIMTTIVIIIIVIIIIMIIKKNLQLKTTKNFAKTLVIIFILMK